MTDQAQDTDRSWAGRLLHTWNVFVEAPSRAANGLVSAGAGALGLLDDASKHLGLSEHTISENLLGYDLKPQEAFNAWLDPKTKARQEYLYGEVIKPETFVEHTIQAAADVGVASGPIAASPLAAPVASASTKVLGPVFSAAKALPGFALKHPFITASTATIAPPLATGYGVVGTILEAPGAQTVGRVGAHMVDWQSSTADWIGDRLGATSWGLPFKAAAWGGHTSADLARGAIDLKEKTGPNPDGFMGNISDNPLMIAGLLLGFANGRGWFNRTAMGVIFALIGLAIQNYAGPERMEAFGKTTKELLSGGGSLLSSAFNSVTSGGVSGVLRNLGLDHIGQQTYTTNRDTIRPPALVPG